MVLDDLRLTAGAEDRAMLGSNPRATPGSKQSGSGRLRPLLLVSPQRPRHRPLCFEPHSINPGGPGAEPLAATAGPPSRSSAYGPEALRLQIDFAQAQPAEPHRIAPLGDALQTYVVAGQRQANADSRIADLHLAAAADPTRQEPRRVRQLHRARIIAPRRTLIHLRRDPQSQRFVWTLFVERPPPYVQHRLLLSARRRGRALQFLHIAVHPLVRTVLFGVARTDPVQVDPQREPPRRQPRQSVGRVPGREGRSIVAADDLRQAMRREQPLHLLLHRLRPRALQRLRTQHIPAVVVPHRQGLEPAPIPRPPPAFEVDRPYLVRSLRFHPLLQPPRLSRGSP